MPEKDSDDLYHQFNYFRTMMYTGFLKSTIGTTLISLGVTIGFMSLSTPSYNENALYMAIIAVAFGFLTYFGGDIYKIEQKKKETRLIDNKITTIKKDTSDQIREEAEKVVKIIVDEEEEKKQTAIKRRMAEMEQGICSDIIKLSENDDSLGYCGQRALNFKILSYPDGYPTDEMIKIATKKAILIRENPDKEWLENYFKILYEDGLISKKKLDECLGAL